MSEHESVFTYGAPALKFGSGASDEIGHDLTTYDARRVLVVTDPGVAATGHPERIAEQIRGPRDRGRGLRRASTSSRPTPASTQAIAFARDGGPWDAFVAVGGGSAIDTAKAVNLLTTQPRRADGLHQRAGRQGPGPAAPAASRWWRCRRPPAPAARAPRSASSTCCR